jgi:predicted permease
MKGNGRLLFGQIFARLRDGVTIDRAVREIDPLLHSAYDEILGPLYPGQPLNPYRLKMEPVAKGVSVLRAQFSRGLQLLMAGAALLLLMACANVAGLLMARSVTRAREIDIRLAVGASPFRLARQLFTEGLILAVLGGTAGILLTVACLPILARALPPIRDRGAVLQPLAMHIGIDLRVLGFTLAITILTAVLFALSPALHAARRRTLQVGRGTTLRLAPRNLIVVGQVAICTLILVGAALLFDTLQRLRTMDPGFDRHHVVTFTVDPRLKAYKPAQTLALSKALLEKGAVLPGVISASLAAVPLMRGTGMKASLAPMGARITANDFLNTSINNVTPGYFQTMGMHLLSGRDFTWFDRGTKPREVIVNQTLAHQFFPGRNPIGERLGFAGPDGIAKGDSQIIGVVSDAKYRSLREPIPPTAYNTAVDGLANNFALELRTSRPPETIISGVRAALRSLDPDMAFIEIRTMKEEVDSSLWQERLLAALSGIFGGIAALVAAIGLYALVDYAVKSRTREIGVRKALGAPQGRILSLLSTELAILMGSGIALGLGAYIGVASWIRSALYEVAPWEPRAIVPAIFLLSTVAVLATAPAAYRALTVNPASALRVD